MPENEEVKVEETEVPVTPKEEEPSVESEDDKEKENPSTEEPTQPKGDDDSKTEEKEEKPEEKKDVYADMLATENLAKTVQIYSSLANQDNYIRSNTEVKKKN